ncbi:AAA family ATPase [bacterium]|nr:AAA family ATPase [bacterium]
MKITSLQKINFQNITVMKTQRQRRKEEQNKKPPLPPPPPEPINPRPAQTAILDELDAAFRINSAKVSSLYGDMHDYMSDAETLQKKPQGVATGDKAKYYYCADDFEKQKQDIIKANQILDERALLLEEKIAAYELALSKIRQEDAKLFDLIAHPPKAPVIEPEKPLPHYKRKGFDRVVGYEHEKEVLQKVFISRIKREKEGEDVGVYGSILFFGPYDNGKSSMINAVAQETGCEVEEHTAYVAEYEELYEYLDDLMAIANEAQERFEKDRTRTIIFIDEIDKVINDYSPIKAAMINFLKHCSKDYHCTVFASTNNPRSMGFDTKDHRLFTVRMSIDPADREVKKGIFEHYLIGRELGEIDYDKIVDRVLEIENSKNAKFSNGQLREICGSYLGQFMSDETVTTETVLNAINNYSVPPKITPELQEKFKLDYDAVMQES